MPGKRAPAEDRIERALEALDQALAGARITWMIIGGIAVIMRGVRRMTTDIDAVVPGAAITPAALVAALGKHGIVPRIPDAVPFARANQVLLLRHAATSVELDVSFAWTPFEQEALEARSQARYGAAMVPAARAEDLVIYKALAARPKDVEDIATLLTLHRDIDLDRVRAHLAHLAELAETPELVGVLERVIKATRAASPVRRRKPSGAPKRTPSGRSRPKRR